MKLSASPLRPGPTRTVLATSGLLATLLCSSGWARAAAPPPDFTILTPRFGSSQTGQVPVTLQYVTNNEDPAVQVQVNGRPLDARRLTKSCQGATCTVTGTLTAWDGLRVGENRLSATLAGHLHLPTSSTASSSTPVLTERTRFDYAYSWGLQSGQYNTINYYTPVSLGLSTLPNGGGPSGNPWLQLTTGYPADWSSTADAWAFPNPPGPPDQQGHPTTITTVTIPYPDVTEGFTCGGETFQAYVLGRQNPYQAGPNDQYVETGACFNTISEFQSFFQNKMGRSLGSQDLVIMGTAPGQIVPAGFDASPLGGTNYSQTLASEYPQAYIMIGVPGASAGSAYESFSIPSANNRPNTSYQPALNGTLMKDQNNNYNFVPSGDTTFEVHSDASTGSYIQVGNTKYTPPASNGNNFWLLILNQETLTPMNAYYAPDTSQNCDPNTSTQSCGATYSVNQDGGNALSVELSASIPSHTLIFLVAQGCPVQNDSQVQLSLGNTLHSLGGVPYSLNYTGATIRPQTYCAYSLVTVNDGNHWHPLNDPLALSVGGAFGFNNQYGSLHGFLARNHQGLYDVAGKAQMIPNSEGTGFASPVDYTFEQVASSQRGDWPLVDTAFPIEAYADISYQILTALAETGSRVYDVRYFYTSSDFLTNTSLGAIITSNLLLTVPNAKPFPQSSWDNATPDQFAAALQQIGTELNQATKAYTYLSQVRNQMASSTSTIYADMIGMAKTISDDYSQASSANANTKLSNVANVLAGAAGIGSAIPEIGPIFGVVNGALTIGSAAVALDNNPPSPEAVFDDTLSNITKDSTAYIRNLTWGFDGAVDNILSDAGKLSTIGVLTLNTDSAWNFPSQISQDQLQAPLVDAAARSIWLDVLPQLFGIRQFLNGPSANPGDYGYYSELPYGACNSDYSGIASSTYGAFTTIGNNKTYDLYVLGEGTKHESAGSDKVVSADLATLLTTNGQLTIGGVQQNGLNFPAMLLYGYSNLNYTPFWNGTTSDDASYCYSH